jgi:hypothetical protein
VQNELLQTKNKPGRGCFFGKPTKGEAGRRSILSCCIDSSENAAEKWEASAERSLGFQPVEKK